MLKIIIVEDEDIIRSGLVLTINWLKMDAIIVAEGRNGEDGLEKILECNPDIVITDIKMPKMNGLDMLEKARERGCKFESIVLTSYSDFEYAKKSIGLKVFDYVLKPVAEDKLEQLILSIGKKIEQEKSVSKISESAQNALKVLDIDNAIYSAEKNEYIGKVLEIIKKQYPEKISISAIADELEVSASYLSRTFKKVTNTTFLDFLNKYRMLMAIYKLESGKYKVYEVSELVGFAEYKHFFKLFKKYIGVSPSFYVKQAKNASM